MVNYRLMTLFILSVSFSTGEFWFFGPYFVVSALYGWHKLKVRQFEDKGWVPACFSFLLRIEKHFRFMQTDFPLTKMGNFYPKLFPGLRSILMLQPMSSLPLHYLWSEHLQMLGNCFWSFCRLDTNRNKFIDVWMQNLNPRLWFLKHRLQIKSFHANKS